MLSTADTPIVWDNHACLPLRADAEFLPQLVRYRNAGVSVVSINVGFGTISWEEHIRTLSFMRHWISGQPEHFSLISSVDDVYRCKSQGRLGIVFDIEGMYPVQENPFLVQTFYELGVRWMLIAYNRNNAAGGGCLDEDSGLTSVGRQIIDEMERVGMVLCLSHCGPRTAQEAMEFTRNPTIFSHSNPYEDHPHPRNVSDKLMRKCAEKSGVVGLSGFGPIVGTNTEVALRLVRQLRYVVDLVGPSHVGLGLDYVFDRAELDAFVRQNPNTFPADMESGTRIGMVEPEEIGWIAEALARDNLTDSQISGVLGGNWLRLARSVWR